GTLGVNATPPSEGGAGGNGEGGAICSLSDGLVLTNSTLHGNIAFGGNGGKGGTAAPPHGISGSMSTSRAGHGGPGGSGPGGGPGARTNGPCAKNPATKGLAGKGGSGRLRGSPGAPGVSEGGNIDSAGATVTIRNTVSTMGAADAGPDFAGAAATTSHNLLRD